MGLSGAISIFPLLLWVNAYKPKDEPWTNFSKLYKTQPRPKVSPDVAVITPLPTQQKTSNLTANATPAPHVPTEKRTEAPKPPIAPDPSKTPWSALLSSAESAVAHCQELDRANGKDLVDTEKWIQARNAMPPTKSEESKQNYAMFQRNIHNRHIAETYEKLYKTDFDNVMMDLAKEVPGAALDIHYPSTPYEFSNSIVDVGRLCSDLAHLGSAYQEKLVSSGRLKTNEVKPFKD